MSRPSSPPSEQPQSPAQEASALTRRRIFAGAGGVGALAAVAAVLPAAKLETPAVATAQAPSDDGLYRVTEHVKRYYQTARV